MELTTEIIQRLERIEAVLPSVMDKWLTFREACQYAKVGETVMRQWLNDGLIYGTKTTGQWRIDRESIDDYFNMERA